MNLNYETPNIIDDGPEEYTEILKKFPPVCDLHAAIKVITRESFLRGAERLSMYIFRDCVWFKIRLQVQAPEVSKLMFNHPSLFIELSKQIGSHYVDIKNSSIKKSEECTWVDFPGCNGIIKDDYRLQ